LEGFIKYVVEMGPDSIIYSYKPFPKISFGSGIPKLMGGD
jgi:hypothetical protein